MVSDNQKLQYFTLHPLVRKDSEDSPSSLRSPRTVRAESEHSIRSPRTLRGQSENTPKNNIYILDEM